ncbi:hypothetical protein ACE3NQ_28370 [Paenibacillus terreus]|uniref:GxGYxYP putative glycoside hydrolase C-terminal domain-containing protein n=1 Tax=Paenibacillus terreus TaxID=1387834 RepID=A0ABV5BHE3_9BACL
MLAEAKANWDGQSPLFVSIELLAWSLTPTYVATISDSLGPEYKVVLADQYFSLIHEANKLPSKP